MCIEVLWLGFRFRRIWATCELAEVCGAEHHHLVVIDVILRCDLMAVEFPDLLHFLQESKFADASPLGDFLSIGTLLGGEFLLLECVSFSLSFLDGVSLLESCFVLGETLEICLTICSRVDRRATLLRHG